MNLDGHHYSWACALKLEQERGGLGAFMFAASRVEELEAEGESGDLALWRDICQRMTDLHMVDNRVLH